MGVLKRSNSGIELEINILDNEGKISNNANELIHAIRKKHKTINIVHEETQNMIELKSLPKVRLKDSLPRLFDELETVLDEMEKKELIPFGLGSYPGKFESKLVEKKRYLLQSKIFDPKKQLFCWSHCAGFHFHYTLPKGVFDAKKKFLKPLYGSKTKQTMIDSFNLLVAVDPASTALMQSSPFIDGKFLAKDSRMLLIRNPKHLDYPKSLFSELGEFGELPNYTWTMQDLRHKLINMDTKMKRLIKKAGFSGDAKKKKILDFVWTAVKINRHGTLEQRGSDMNHPKYFAGMAVLFKSIQRIVQQKFYKVEVSDIGIKEPFKVEGEKIYIPPQSYVKLKLQNASAYKGFEDKEIYNYVKRFYNFGKMHTNKDYLKLLEPIKKLIDRKETVSDVLIKRAKKKGYSITDTLPQNVCREIALQHSTQFVKETHKIKEILSGLE